MLTWILFEDVRPQAYDLFDQSNRIPRLAELFIITINTSCPKKKDEFGTNATWIMNVVKETANGCFTPTTD